MFVKGSVRINLQKFFRVTTAILFLVAAQLLVSGLHELSESGVLPSSKREMAIIGPIVSNDVFFFVTIIALAALMVLFDAKRREPAPCPTSPGGAAQGGCGRARRERLWMASVYTFSFVFIALVTAEFVYTKSVSALLAGDRSDVHERASEHSARASLRWRSAPLSGKGERHGGSLLALSEAGRKDRDGVRCLRDLRCGGILQERQRSGLQELRRADQSAVGGHGGRMQSDSAEGDADG